MFSYAQVLYNYYIDFEQQPNRRVNAMATAIQKFFELYTDVEIPGRVTDSIEQEDVESCRQMYLSIIELAVNDYRFLQRMSGQERKSRYDR